MLIRAWMILTTLAVLLWPQPALPQPLGEVSHTVSFPDLNQQYIHLRSEFPVGGIAATIKMANWTPGSYLIRDFANNLDRIQFFNDLGEPLAFHKPSKNTWQVTLSGATRIVAEYDVHAGDLSVRTSWASQEYVLINGASVFLYSDTSREMPHRVSVTAPNAFDTISSSMTPSGQNGNFVASGFDELVDSPIVISGDMAHHFSDGPSEFWLLNVGETELWNGVDAAKDLRVLVAETNKFWGTVPFEKPYWFFNFLVEQGGGLEHNYSTVIMGSRWQMLDREEYIKWLALATHEYFHAWNVRRMRPASLSKYDYENEQYSGALWLAEGITSYYENLLLSRAGLIVPVEYFKQLAIDLHALEMTPGRKLISLDQASRDAWIRSYKPDAHSINSSVSYYTKGSVLGLVLDARIRLESKDSKSLDDVLRLMFQRWSETAYPDNAFPDAVEEIAGREVRTWLDELLETPGELNIDEALAYYGLAVDRHPVNNAAREIGGPLLSGIGVNWDTEVDGMIIKNVISETSGSAGALLPGDELLAIDGERTKEDNFDKQMISLQPGKEVVLTISRRGLLMEIPLTLQEARPVTYEIKIVPDSGKKALARLESWLGQALEVETD